MSTVLQTETMPDITGERIAALMWRHKYTVTRLADEMGKGRASISTKVNGHARWFLDELMAVASILETTVGYLLGETDDDRRPEHLGEGKQKAPASYEAGANVGPAGLEPATYGLKVRSSTH